MGDTTQGRRVAIYLRVSTDGQTVENQRIALMQVVERRGWQLVATYEDAGISGAKDRHGRPGFDALLKDACRGRYDVLAVWSIDRLGRSTASVTAALAELDQCGVSIYADREGMDSTTPHGRAMLQMASVFGELERAMIRERVLAGLERARKAGKQLGRRRVEPEREAAVRAALGSGMGIIRAAHECGVGVSVAQRVRKEMAA